MSEKFQRLGTRMSIKLHFLHHHVNSFLKLLGYFSDEQENGEQKSDEQKSDEQESDFTFHSLK